MTTDIFKPRGRPRTFDVDQAVGIAQRLFHTCGYDAVGIAAITHALGINPPSFYAAFGSKAGLYARILERYGGTGAIPLETLLLPDRPVAACLKAVLDEAARRYGADPEAAGCLVLEGIHTKDAQALCAARRAHAVAEDAIHSYIAARYPDEAEYLTDFVSATMTGLSAQSRNGHNVERLLATARLAGLALEQALPDRRQSRRDSCDVQHPARTETGG
ncbi:MAG: TetR/AcrR family transcriptional regulator [Janthinobacterium sp.]|uniref:TetR/AcrR family transcriptional regulator n=1 Tax=Janthinobacterium sp. TND4EL3 TaxID=1907311 RepID=UPI0009567944|nr:TetR/AcrR family transcriptional regulator [Janthinobacterium sp. TND4EL3]SIR87162.1 transcriptional regulator, TetR family [Janthinobacterium sp. TND4EL3]